MTVPVWMVRAMGIAVIVLGVALVVLGFVFEIPRFFITRLGYLPRVLDFIGVGLVWGGVTMTRFSEPIKLKL